MIKTVEGNLIVRASALPLPRGRFNDFITKELIAGCVDTLVRHGAEKEKIQLVMVPGAFEIPLIAKKLALSKEYDAVICLGAVIRGLPRILNMWPP